MPDATREPVLPESFLTPEVHIAVPSERWATTLHRLREDTTREACAFILTKPSHGVERTTVLLGDVIWPEPGDVDASWGALEISADYITRALERALEDGPHTGIALVHTHPSWTDDPGPVAFSPRDDRYELRLFPTFAVGRPQALHASIVIGDAGNDFDARIWWNDDHGLHTQDVQVLREVGPVVRFHESAHSTWTDHPDPVVMDRSTRALGLKGRRLMQNLRVGIVGLGGTGSIAQLSLATLGVGRIRSFDRDTIEKHNRPRLLGGRRSGVGRPKVHHLAEVARAAATADPFELDPVEDWGTTKASLRALRDCDLILCCVDLYAPRVPLNDLAYSHLIPVVDMGTRIYPFEERIEDILMHAQVWTVGLPCAWCNQTLTALRLRREAQGKQAGIEERAAYGLPVEDHDDVDPSVLPFNLMSVALALLHVFQVVFQMTPRTAHDLRFLLPTWEIDESDLKPRPDCDCQTNVALGEALDIRPVEPQEDK